MAVKTLKEPVTWKRFFTSEIETYKGLPGEPVLDFRESTPELRICDGVTPGGHAVGGGGTYGIAIPQVVAPVNGATGVDSSPIITATAFSGITSASTADSHAASTWTFYSDANKTTQLHTSGRDTTNLTSYDLSAAGVSFNGGQQVFVEVEYEGSSGATAISPLVVFTVTDIGEGAVIDGDIVVGQLNGEWVLVAPASKRVLRKWGLYGKDTTLPNNPNPDPNSSTHNTDVLTSATYNSYNDGQGSIGAPAADYCRSLGAEYDLPNRTLATYIYDNMAAIDAADDSVGTKLSDIANGPSDASNGYRYIWSSTEGSSYRARYVRLSDGYQGNGHKGNAFWVVPVRTIAV